MQLSLWPEYRSVLAWTALITDAASALPTVRRVADPGSDGARPLALLALHLLVAAACVYALRRRAPHREFLQ
jgi:hypothetical protein